MPNFSYGADSVAGEIAIAKRENTGKSADGFLANDGTVRAIGKLSSVEAAKCVATWVSRTSAADVNWRWVAWSAELGLFATVSETGTGNRIMTSPDGVTWTSRTSPADNEWFGICWAPALGLFISVAETGSLDGAMTSPDGITWTKRTTPSNNEWRGVAWSPELGIAVAVANSGADAKRAMSSTNGIDWVARDSAPVGNGWTGVCWSPELGLFCAVGSSGGGNRCMTSTNGTTWTERTPAAAITWVMVAWSPELGLFCAVAADSGIANCVMTSPDGISWTIRTAHLGGWVGIVWSPELSLFCAIDYAGPIMTSPDGITWTTRTNPTGIDTRGIEWSPELGIFVTVASSGTGNRVNTSTFPTKYNASGNYTPVLTNVANLDATISYPAQWVRVGKNVTVSGIISANPTAGAATEVGISLPIPSNLAYNYQCCGSASCPAIAGQIASIVGDATNNRASMQWIAVDTTAQLMSYQFTYSII